MRLKVARAVEGGGVALIAEQLISGDSALVVDMNPVGLGTVLDQPSGTSLAVTLEVHGAVGEWRTITATSVDLNT